MGCLVKPGKAAGFRALALALFLCSCGGDDTANGGVAPVVIPPFSPSPPPSPPPPTLPSRPASVERTIATTTIDTAISTAYGAVIAINPDPGAVPKERLFVMLPGTGGTPNVQRLILRAGIARGYHVIGLPYRNETTVADYCAGISDVNCTGNVRREIITGADTSGQIVVDSTNSIAGRLTRTLNYLNTTYPTEGWGRFLSGGALDWSVVTVAGHSQGSGHAAYMGKLYSLDRLVMFSGPSDVGTGNGASAAWLSLPNVTPASRQYGFTHTADELVPYALVLNNWGLMGLGNSGAPNSVDGASPPYGNSHQLTTSAAYNPSAPNAITYPYHLATVLDTFVPLTAQGTPVYSPVWEYLAFP
jgi:hypothetical protein